MPTEIMERAKSSEEQEDLQDMAEDTPSRLGPLRLAFNVGVASWFIAMMLMYLCWSPVAWLVRISTGIEMGPDSAAADWLLQSGWLVAAVVAVVTAVFWVKGRKNNHPGLMADLEAGQVVEEYEAAQVVEEDYEFTAALRMQEQEHGGLIYFLRSTEGKVFVLYDAESQQLGVLDDDLLSSGFKPCSRLTMVRALETGYVIDKVFSGEPLDAGEPLEITVSPKHWPEDEDYCDIPWDNLEATFCR